MKKFIPLRLFLMLSLMSALAHAEAKAAHAEAFQEIMQVQEGAWNSGDAERWGSVYWEDSHFVNILGMHFPDRSTNVKRHADLFAGIFAGSTITIKIQEITFLGEAHAHVETIFTLTGHRRLPPGIVETAPGELHTRMHYLMKKTDGEWKVFRAQNTALSPLTQSASAP